MPQGYVKMKEAFIKAGMDDKDAETKAAKIWNSKHKGSLETVGRGRK